MFSGIVEGTGTIRTIAPDRGGIRLVIAAGRLAKGLRVGASVSVSGVCLTAGKITRPGIEFRLVPETLRRTMLGGLRRGSKVNLERALRHGDPIDGHPVAGHVDGTGRVMSVRREGNGRRIAIRPPAGLMKYVARKGSIAVDGVSLTVAAVRRSGFEIALIPHTLRITTLGTLRTGSSVNLEADLFARYAERLLASRRKRGR